MLPAGPPLALHQQKVRPKGCRKCTPTRTLSPLAKPSRRAASGGGTQHSPSCPSRRLPWPRGTTQAFQSQHCKVTQHGAQQAPRRRGPDFQTSYRPHRCSYH